MKIVVVVAARRPFSLQAYTNWFLTAEKMRKQKMASTRPGDRLGEPADVETDVRNAIRRKVSQIGKKCLAQSGRSDPGRKSICVEMKKIGR